MTLNHYNIFMSMLSKKIDNILSNKLINRHSKFQIRFFVIGKEPTTQSRLNQCIRELQTRRETRDSIEFEIEEMQDQLELLNLDLSHFESKKSLADNLTNKKREINIRQLKRKIVYTSKKIEQLESKLIDIDEESSYFVQAFETLLVEEPLKDWDDFEVQLEYWNAKFANEFQTRNILNRPIDAELFNSVLALPDQAPVKKSVMQSIKAEIENEKLLEKKNG